MCICVTLGNCRQQHITMANVLITLFVGLLLRGEWLGCTYGWMSMQEEEFDELWVGLTNKDFSLTLLRLLRQICIGSVYSWHVVAEKSSELIVVEV